MPRAIVILALIAAAALAGCGSAGQAGSPRPTAPRKAPAFPVGLPVGSELAFALRQTAPVLTGSHVAIKTSLEGLALATGRRAYVSCRAGRALKPVGMVPAALAARWRSLLTAARLTRIASDPPAGQGRSFWFLGAGRVLHLDFARHVHPLPCTGTACTALLGVDSTLRALMPATQAFTGFIASHCPLS